jgi:hypothetical protein
MGLPILFIFFHSFSALGGMRTSEYNNMIDITVLQSAGHILTGNLCRFAASLETSSRATALLGVYRVPATAIFVQES